MKRRVVQAFITYSLLPFNLLVEIIINEVSGSGVQTYKSLLSCCVDNHVAVWVYV